MLSKNGKLSSIFIWDRKLSSTSCVGRGAISTGRVISPLVRCAFALGRGQLLAENVCQEAHWHRGEAPLLLGEVCFFWGDAESSACCIGRSSSALGRGFDSLGRGQCLVKTGSYLAFSFGIGSFPVPAVSGEAQYPRGE